MDSVRDKVLQSPNEYAGHRRKAIEHLSSALEELGGARADDPGAADGSPRVASALDPDHRS